MTLKTATGIHFFENIIGLRLQRHLVMLLPTLIHEATSKTGSTRADFGGAQQDVEIEFEVSRRINATFYWRNCWQFFLASPKKCNLSLLVQS